MAVKIISKDERPLLSRIEVHAQIDFTGKPTPSKADLKKEISALEKAGTYIPPALLEKLA